MTNLLDPNKTYATNAEQRIDRKSKILDAAGIAFSYGELEAVEQTIYETIFAPLESLSHVPVATNYSPVTDTISYEVATRTGVAKTMNRKGDDRPEAGNFLAKFSSVVEEGGAAYSYSVDAGEVASLTGFNLATENAKAAAMMIAEWHNLCALDGSPLAGSQTGFANNSNVAISQAVQTWTVGTTAGSVLFNDVADLINKIPESSDGAHTATDIAMSIAVWNACAITLFSATTGATVLEKLRQNYPNVNFTQWAALKTQGTVATNHRIIAYQRSAANAVYQATVMYDEDIPVRGNFQFNVACRGRGAGVTVRYPLSMKYLDITIA